MKFIALNCAFKPILQSSLYSDFYIFDFHFKTDFMKSSLLMFFIAISPFVFAQVPIDAETGKAKYEEVVTVSGADSKELYKRLDHWFMTYFKNPASVVESKDEAGGIIKGKHRVDLYTKHPGGGVEVKKGLEYYTITVGVKDGKYRYTINDIFLHTNPKVYIESWLGEKADANHKYWVSQTHTAITKLIEDLKNAMSKPVPTAKEDNW
jgi:hypothetical protein